MVSFICYSCEVFIVLVERLEVRGEIQHVTHLEEYLNHQYVVYSVQ